MVRLFYFIFFLFAIIGAHAQPTRQKAVLVVGPCEDITAVDIAESKRIARLLRNRGISVHEFYHPQADWKAITKATSGADLFVYMGHGTTMGEGGSPGGFFLSGNRFVSAAAIREELKLKAGALVLFQSVCYGAGSTAGDTVDIQVREAMQRVSSYARPFIEGGAGAYFAVNVGGGAFRFLDELLQGKTIREGFDAAARSGYTVDSVASFSASAYVGVASRKGGGSCTRTTWRNGVAESREVPSVRSFDIAFVAPQSWHWPASAKRKLKVDAAPSTALKRF